jgi:hypothetical protein
MNHKVSGNCMDCAEKVGFCYTSHNFLREDSREKKDGDYYVVVPPLL